MYVKTRQTREKRSKDEGVGSAFGLKAWESFDFLLRGGDGLLFLLRRGYRPSAEGERLTFSFPKRKSYKKKLATLQVDRYANQLSRKSFFVSEGAVCFGKLYLHQKIRDTEFLPTRLFCQFDWRVGAYPSAPLALSPARRMGTDRRGAWKVSEFSF